MTSPNDGRNYDQDNNAGDKGGGPTHTDRAELLPTTLNVDGSFKSFCVLRAASEEPPSDILIDLLLITSEITCMRGWMNRWMSLIIVPPFPWPLVTQTRTNETAKGWCEYITR